MRIQAFAVAAALLAVVMAPTVAGTDGAKLFKQQKSTTCHFLDESGKKKVGPSLSGVVGRPIAAAPGFKYSKGLVKYKGRT
ncbi:MAG: hypothetical protein OXE76_06745 [Alphaproteobacteria bacterium]|nr:hypothetical protein [Alphaproteobacteria bacterium]